jgi:hypothetical protein
MKQSRIIKYGKILKNYLVDYPQHILNNSDANYGIVIGTNELTLGFDFSEVVETTNTFTIHLPIVPNSLNNFVIEWGDETETMYDGKSTEFSHTYSNITSENSYIEIRFFGTVYGFNNKKYGIDLIKNKVEFENNICSAWDYLTKIVKWGNTILYSPEYGFYNAKMLETISNDESLPVTVLTLSHAFENCISLTKIPSGKPFLTNDHKISDMAYCFYNCSGSAFTTIPRNFIIPNSFDTVEGLFKDCKSIKTIETSEKVTPLFGYSIDEAGNILFPQRN